MYFKSKKIIPKKRLGQTFLIDRNIQKKIISACELKDSEIILEIGAGSGELTQLIADSTEMVFGVEIDSCLCQILKDRFRDNPNVKIIEQDILKFNLKRYFKKVDNKLKIIGNIPYYITSPIIEHLLRFRDKIESIFISVQKEFAKRITARPGSKEYGSFSCFVQYYSEPKIIFPIKRSSFKPIPKVDSYFLRLDIRDKPILVPEKERLFFKIVRTAFSQRRKTLRNSLREIISSQDLNLFFKMYNINSNIRPENLHLKDFFNLTNLIKNK